MTEFFQQLYREQEYRHPVVVQRVKQDFGEDEFKDLTTDKKLVLVNYLLNDQFRANEYKEYTKDQKRDHLTWILDKYDKSRIAKVPQNTFEESLQYFYDTINSTILRFNYITDKAEDRSVFKDYKEQKEEFLNFQKNLLSTYGVTDYQNLSASQKGNFDRQIHTKSYEVLDDLWDKEQPMLIKAMQLSKTPENLNYSSQLQLFKIRYPFLYRDFKQAIGEEEFSIISDKQKYMVLLALSGHGLDNVVYNYHNTLDKQYRNLKKRKDKLSFIRTVNNLYKDRDKIHTVTNTDEIQLLLNVGFENYKNIEQYVQDNSSQDFTEALTKALGNKKEYENFSIYKKYIALKFYQISDEKATSEEKEEELKTFLAHSDFRKLVKKIPIKTDIDQEFDNYFYDSDDEKKLSALERKLSFYQKIDNYDKYSVEKKIKMLSIMSNYTQIINDLNPIEQKEVVNHIAIVATKPDEQQNEQEHEEIENNFKNYIIDQYIQHCSKPLNSSGQVNEDHQNYQILQNKHIYSEKPESQFFFLQTLSHMRKRKLIKDDNLTEITTQAMNFVDAFVESHKTHSFEYSLKILHGQLVNEFGPASPKDEEYKEKNESNKLKMQELINQTQLSYAQELQELRELEIKNNGNKVKAVNLIDGINDFSLNKQYFILKYFKQLSDYPGREWTQYAIYIYDKLYPEERNNTNQNSLFTNDLYIQSDQFCDVMSTQSDQFCGVMFFQQKIIELENDYSEFLNEILDYDKMNDIQKYFILKDVNKENLQQMKENERQIFFQDKIHIFNSHMSNIQLPPNTFYSLPFADYIYNTIMQAEYEADVYTTYKMWSSLDDSSKCVDESNEDIIKKLENYGQYIEYKLLTQKEDNGELSEKEQTRLQELEQISHTLPKEQISIDELFYIQNLILPQPNPPSIESTASEISEDVKEEPQVYQEVDQEKRTESKTSKTMPSSPTNSINSVFSDSKEENNSIEQINNPSIKLENFESQPNPPSTEPTILEKREKPNMVLNKKRTNTYSISNIVPQSASQPENTNMHNVTTMPNAINNYGTPNLQATDLSKLTINAQKDKSLEAHTINLDKAPYEVVQMKNGKTRYIPKNTKQPFYIEDGKLHIELKNKHLRDSISFHSLSFDIDLFLERVANYACTNRKKGILKENDGNLDVSSIVFHSTFNKKPHEIDLKDIPQTETKQETRRMLRILERDLMFGKKLTTKDIADKATKIHSDYIKPDNTDLFVQSGVANEYRHNFNRNNPKLMYTDLAVQTAEADFRHLVVLSKEQGKKGLYQWYKLYYGEDLTQASKEEQYTKMYTALSNIDYYSNKSLADSNIHKTIRNIVTKTNGINSLTRALAKYEGDIQTASKNPAKFDVSSENRQLYQIYSTNNSDKKNYAFYGTQGELNTVLAEYKKEFNHNYSTIQCDSKNIKNIGNVIIDNTGVFVHENSLINVENMFTEDNTKVKERTRNSSHNELNLLSSVISESNGHTNSQQNRNSNSNTNLSVVQNQGGMNARKLGNKQKPKQKALLQD